MANFQRQYTGENFGVRLSDDKIGAAQQRMNNLILGADKMVYDSFKENEKRFADMTDVDLETYLSTASANAQSKMVEDYNKIATDIVRKRKGFQNLTPEDWQELNLGRKVLEGKQKQMIANQERYMTDREMVQRNPDKYDMDKWNQQFATEYLQSGQYPEAPLPIKAKDVSNALMLASQKINREYSPTPIEKTEGGIRYRNTQTTNLLPEEVDDFIIGNILGDDAMVQGLIEDFDAEPESVKLRYLDADNSGSLDSGERSVATTRDMKRDNPLLQYAIENPRYRRSSVTTKLGTWQPIPTPKSTTTAFNWNIGIGAGNNQNAIFDKQKNITLGKETFDTFLSLGWKSFTSDPQMIQTYRDLDTGQKRDLNKATRFEVVGYSPDKDMLVVKVVDRVTGLREGKLIGLDATQYDDLLRSKPFGIDRESLRKGGVEEGASTTPTMLAAPKQGKRLY